MQEVFRGTDVDGYAGPVSAFLTRLNQPNMPNNICPEFVGPPDLCAPVSYMNQCTNL